MTPSPGAAVTGLGLVSAAGHGLEATFSALFAGPPRPVSPRFASPHGAAYPVFALPLQSLARCREAAPDAPSPTTAYLCAAAREALADAGLNPASLAGVRVGVCVGTTVGAALNFFDHYAALRRGEKPSPGPVAAYLAANPALYLARRLGAAGPCQSVVNACSSGSDAVGLAASWITQGLCDVALAGGADELSPIPYHGFIRLMITDPGPCRPFDRGRKGLNLGEGAALLVLESEAFRAARGARARGFVAGYGAAADAHHLTAPAPDGRGLRAAIGQALARAGASPGELAFVSLHGTGTPDNDRVEGRVVAALLPGAALSATKGATGHSLGAAGAMEAAITVRCLEAGRLPPSPGFAEPDPEIGAAPVGRETEVRGRAALSLSLAFGGGNAALVLTRGER